MTFDERLKRAVDTLGDKFRDELSRELESLAHDWAAQVPPAPEPAPEPEPPPAAVPAPPGDGAIGRLADTMRAIDYAQSLSDILDALATAASNEAARAAVFLVRGDHVRSFRFSGFPALFGDAPIDIPLNLAGVLGEAITQRIVVTGTTSPFDELPEGVEAIAIPLLLAGSAVGALYAEGADAATLEILTRFASRALEAQTALKTARAIAEGGTAVAEVDVV